MQEVDDVQLLARGMLITIAPQFGHPLPRKPLNGRGQLMSFETAEDSRMHWEGGLR